MQQGGKLVPAVVGELPVLRIAPFGLAVGRVEIEEGVGAVVAPDAVGEVELLDGSQPQPLGNGLAPLPGGQDAQAALGLLGPEVLAALLFIA